MQKRLIPLSERSSSGFTWMRDPEFIPPDRDGGMDACITHEISSPRSGALRTLLKTILESIVGTVNATAGVVRLLSPDGHTLRIIGSAGLSAELQEEAENFVELDCEVNDKATFGHVIHASDISTCDVRSNCPYSSCRFQSLVAAPLESSSEANVPLGILTLFFDAPRDSSKNVMNTIAAFAEVMSAAIEHTRANRESSRMERIAARQEIANEIHDSIAQTLTYARMRSTLLRNALNHAEPDAAARYAQDIEEALVLGQKTTRALVKDFRCEMGAGGLLEALRNIVDQFRKQNDIRLDYHNRIVDLELPLEYEIQIAHIVREALTNIARHSGATHARLFVDSDFGYHVFTIEDNGKGAETFTDVEGHYGVKIMRERAQRIGGDIRVDSTPGLGTLVQLYFPEPPPDWRTSNA